MCLIYLSNLKEIILIIFFIMNNIELNDNNVILSDEKIKNLFSDILLKTKLKENKYDGIKFGLNKKNNEKYTVKIFYLKNIEKLL